MKNPRKHAFGRKAHLRGRPPRARFRRARAGSDDGGVPLRVAYGDGRTRQSSAAYPQMLATENAVRRLTDDNIELPVEPELVRPNAIAARLSPDAVHQGLLAEADPFPRPHFRLRRGRRRPRARSDHRSPNVGAILRTAAAFAVAAIVPTARHSPEATGVFAKSASGALEWVPIVIVQNLARALTEMKEQGFLVVGLDSDAPQDLSALDFAPPLALVLGAEGKGLRQGTRAVCDRLARLKLPGAIKVSTCRMPRRSPSTSRAAPSRHRKTKAAGGPCRYEVGRSAAPAVRIIAGLIPQ